MKVALVIFSRLGNFYAWQQTAGVEMSVHGYVAMILGVIFSLVIGCGLMALVFFSSRHGYDEPPDLGA
jgi:hypothetical protein